MLTPSPYAFPYEKGHVEKKDLQCTSSCMRGFMKSCQFFFERKFMDSMPDLLWLDTYFTHRSTSRRTFLYWQVWYPHECNEAIFFFYINICVRKLVHLLKIIFGIFSQTVCQAARQQGQFPLCLLNIISTVRLHNIACSDTDIFLSHA